MGLLSGAMSGFGGAVADIAGGHIKNEINLDYQSQLMAMQEQRDARADERRQRMKRDDDQYAFDKKVERNPQEIEMEVGKKRAVGDVENEQMRTREGNRRVDDLGFKVKNLGEMTKVEREMAKARDMDGEGRGIRNDLGREQVESAKQVRADREERARVMDEYSKAVDSGDEAAVRRAQMKVDAVNRKVGYHNDPLSSKVAAARAVLNQDSGATPEQRESATRFLSEQLGEARKGSAPEVRFKGREAYVKGPNGVPVRAPQYDKK